jgi:hypothetical protein
MEITVEITRASFLPDLIDTLRRSGCLVDRVTSSVCRVVHVHASSPDEARVEVAFFLRAWQLRHPEVAATISSQ